MADQTPMNEMLSALADGETNEFELRRLLREIEQQAEGQALQERGKDTLPEQWRRFHVLRSVLRNDVDSEGKSLPATDISAAVAKAIAGEDVDWQEAVDMPSETKQSLPWRSMAVAASLSVIAVMGFQNYSVDGGEQLLAEKKTGSGVSSQFNTPLGSGGGQLATLKPEAVLPSDLRGDDNKPRGQLLSAPVEGEVVEVERSDVVVEAPN